MIRRAWLAPPADVASIGAFLLPLFVTLASPDVGPAEDVSNAAYLVALQHEPAEAIAEACSLALRGLAGGTPDFVPRPPVLARLARSLAAPVLAEATAIGLLLAAPEEPPLPKRSAEEIARVEALVEQARREFAGVVRTGSGRLDRLAEIHEAQARARRIAEDMAARQARRAEAGAAG